MKTIGIINGPNLDRLGKREPEVYGSQTLKDLEKLLTDFAEQKDIKLSFFQSNHEGDIIDKVSAWSDEGFSAVIINPGALTHTSIALRDAIAGSESDFIEVHISNIYSREDFRKTSLTAPVCKGVISGLGFDGYVAALNFLSLTPDLS
jgi:3-dehydroquinate dehydratase II